MPAPPDARLDEHLHITTPEQVTLELPVAGLAMRMVALFIDTLILGILYLGVVALRIPGLRDLGQAIQIALGSATLMGYFLAFEYFTHGRTPGKAATHLRVVTPAGDVPTLTQFFLRNLLRPADLFLSALGVELFLLFWSPRSQRLGDLAAGTLVIRDQTVRLQDVEQALARHEFLTVSAGHAGDAWVRRVEPADIELLRRFLARQHSLARDQRRELASRIVQHFESKFGTALLHSGLTDDEKLTRYWEALSSRHAGP